jgi:SynChlorMet cassette radical SAM/SPASM protein ScmF
MHSQDGALDIAELIALGQKVERELAPSTPLRLYFDHPMAFRPLSRMFGANGDGCGRCGILGILGVLSSGRYALCGVGEQVPEMVFGDARSDRLETIWLTHPVLESLRSGMPEKLEGICGDCLMKNLCLGSCIAQNYYRSRSLWSPFWFCERARALGLFPEQRRTDSPRGLGSEV